MQGDSAPAPQPSEAFGHARAATARIFSEDDAVGVAFLISARHLLTCAHVVAQALDVPYTQAGPPDAAVQLDFPLIAPGQILSARLVSWHPSKVGRSAQAGNSDDIAVLELAADPPPNSRPLRLTLVEDPWDHPLRTYGFPEGPKGGVWASGVFLAGQGDGLIQIEDTKQTGYFVRPGFSGSPVWDERTGGFVGMVAGVDRRTEIRAAFMIPAATLIKAWPDLAASAMPPCPYRGLFAFREEDAAYFFGRETFVEQLVDAVAKRSLVAVIGASGSGKSSVVLAGLLPQVRSDTKLPTLIATVRPGACPFCSLAAELIPLLEAGRSVTEQLLAIPKLATALADGTLKLRSVVERLLANHPGSQRLLLVVDQFEELYAPRQERDEHQRVDDRDVHLRFQDQLLDALAQRTPAERPPLTLVLTLRADALGHALSHRAFADALQVADLKLGPMGRADLKRVIEEPARKLAVRIDDGLTERILDALGDETGDLPLLEFALTELWGQQDHYRLTHAAYDAIGGVENALTLYAEDVFDDLDPAAREQARRVFTQLVRPGEGTVGTRRQATRAELGEAGWDLVSRLATSRLVVSGRNDSTQQETVEIVHEDLIGRWQRLRTWTETDRLFRIWQDRLRIALEQWDASKHDEGALLRGFLLDEAERWQHERGPDLSESERGFIEASRAAEERERAQEAAWQRARERRNRRIFGGVVAAAIVLFSLALLAFSQYVIASEQRQIAAARALAALATTTLTRDPELSVLLAAEAVRTRPIVQARATLREAIFESHLRTRIAAHDGTAWSVSFDPSGQRIVTAGEDGAVRVWDSVQGSLLRGLPGHEGWVGSAVFDTSGQRIVTAGKDRTARVWDAESGELLQTLAGHTAPVWTAEISPSGRQIVTASEDGTARIWDRETGQQEQVLQGRGGKLATATFGANGTRIATAEDDGVAAIWQIGSDAAPVWLEGHTGAVKMVRFDPSGDRVVTASADRNAMIWVVQTGQALVPLVGHGGPVNVARFSPDGRSVLTASDDRTARIWNAATGSLRVELRGHNGGVINAVFSPDGRRIVTVSWDGTARIWDAATGDPIGELRGQYGWLSSPTFTANGAWIATAGMDGTVRIWDAGTENLLAQLSAAPDATDERWSVTSESATVRVRATDTDAVLAELDTARRPATEATRVFTSPDGARSVTIDGWGGNLRDVAANRTIVELRGPMAHRGPVRDVAFTPKSTRFVTVSDDQAVRLWDASTGGSLGELRGHTAGVVLARFSLDGRFLLTASDDGTVRIWDVELAAPVAIMRGLAGAVRDATFGPDDYMVATVSADGTVSLFSCQACVAVEQLLDLARGRARRSLTPEERVQFFQELPI